MPWVRARLRDQLIFARAGADGALVAENGSVEIRYKPTDGKLYRARVENLTVTDPTPLPDETCAEAAPVENKKAAAKTAAASAVFAPGTLVAYTDGACSGNPGPAGLGVVLIDGDTVTEISEYLGQGTNNIAELTAVLRAVERMDDRARPIVIHTDSQYSIGVLTKGWKAKANTELIVGIRQALAACPKARIVYVPGHSGVPLNERADQLARDAVETRSSRVRSPTAVRAAVDALAKPAAPAPRVLRRIPAASR